VQVDEAGSHQLARRVDALDGSVGRDARGHRCDLAEADTDVALGACLLHRIDHVAIGDHQLVLQRGIGGIEAERRGRPGLGDQERRAGRGRPVRVPLARECAAGCRRARGQGEEMPAREIDGSGWWAHGGLLSALRANPGLREPGGIVAQGPTLRKTRPGARAGQAPSRRRR